MIAAYARKSNEKGSCKPCHKPQLVQVALDAQGHNAIGENRDGGVWRLHPNSFISLSACSSQKPAHLAVHRRRGGEVFLRLQPLARAPVESAEAEVAVARSKER